MGGSEGEPDRAAAAEEVLGIPGRGVVAKQAERPCGGEERAGPEGQVEAGHEHVRALELKGEVHDPYRSAASTAPSSSTTSPSSLTEASRS